MIENYGPRERYGRAFSDNTLLGNDGDSFFEHPLGQQVDEISWSEGCPVRKQVVKNNGPEAARDRYGEVIFARQMILEEARKHNQKLYSALSASLPRNPYEPVGTHEADSIPESHLNVIDPNNTPWGFSLPRVLLNIFGERPKRTQESILAGLDILERTIKTVSSPLEFLSVLAQQAVNVNADIDAVLKSTLSRGYFDEENTRYLFQELATQLKIHAPKVWKRYSELDVQTKKELKIAHLPQKLEYFEWDGQLQRITFMETQQVAPGVECDVYVFVGDTTKDLGIIRIKPGHKTPLQRVLQGEKTIEGHRFGLGQLMVTRGNDKPRYYEVKNPSDVHPVVKVMVGDIMQWQAEDDSELEVYEICFPPYADGRYENLTAL